MTIKMTEQQHPITPPPELVRQWLTEERERGLTADHGFTQAAQWGADQELEACCEWLVRCAQWVIQKDVDELRAARRPKLPSLKEQALKVLSETELRHEWTTADEDIIRRALEQLPDPS